MNNPTPELPPPPHSLYPCPHAPHPTEALAPGRHPLLGPCALRGDFVGTWPLSCPTPFLCFLGGRAAALLVNGGLEPSGDPPQCVVSPGPQQPFQAAECLRTACASPPPGMLSDPPGFVRRTCTLSEVCGAGLSSRKVIVPGPHACRLLRESGPGRWATTPSLEGSPGSERGCAPPPPGSLRASARRPDLLSRLLQPGLVLGPQPARASSSPVPDSDFASVPSSC